MKKPMFEAMQIPIEPKARHRPVKMVSSRSPSNGTSTVGDRTPDLGETNQGWEEQSKGRTRLERD